MPIFVSKPKFTLTPAQIQANNMTLYYLDNSEHVVDLSSPASCALCRFRHKPDDDDFTYCNKLIITVTDDFGCAKFEEK